jgi:hypothetical protein
LTSTISPPHAERQVIPEESGGLHRPPSHPEFADSETFSVNWTGPLVDHLVIGCVDLETGVDRVTQRLGVAPAYGGVHVGTGTCNAPLGLGEQYMEVLALGPAQRESQSTFRSCVESLVEHRLITVAIAKSDLGDPVEMSRIGPDGVRIEWAMLFTPTPLFFIDREGSPHVGFAY